MREAYLEFLSHDKWLLLASAFAEDAPGVFTSPDRVLNHLHAFEALFGAIEQPTSAAEDTRPRPLYVLAPRITMCTRCNVQGTLQVQMDGAWGSHKLAWGADESEAGDLLGLKETGVVRCRAYKHVCRKCGAEFCYDVNVFKTLPAEHAAHTGTTSLPYRRYEFVDDICDLAFFRVSMNSRLVVATEVLVGHHARNLRGQESAEGCTDALRAKHRMMGVNCDWGCPKNAGPYLDRAYFKWLVLKRQFFLRSRCEPTSSASTVQPIRLSTPDEFEDRDAMEGVYQRTSVLLEGALTAVWAEEHNSRCLLLDDCKILIVDGNHKTKWPCCMASGVRYYSLGEVGSVPAGCDHDRLLNAEFCRVHLAFLGRRDREQV